MKTFADMPKGRDNHFNLIRLLAAAAVLVSHSFPLAIGTGATEPLERLTGYSLGALAVYIFFGISGYMIAGSFVRSGDAFTFIAARFARIMPGLLVVLVITAGLLGPIVTDRSLGAYLNDLRVWTYVPRNLSLAFLQYELPGVFAANPYPGAINGSLWTLFWEVACYAMVFLLGVAGWLAARPFGVFLVFYGLLLGVSVLFEPGATWARLSAPFVVGMALHIYRSSVPVGWLPLVAVALAAILLRATLLWPVAYAAAVAYAALWLGHVRAPVLLHFNRLGDYSYGTYIYAFPVQQLLVWQIPGISVGAMILIALPITLALAALSWHLIESPVLERRKDLAALLRRGLGRSRLPAPPTFSVDEEPSA